MITAWKEDLDELLQVFNVRSVCLASPLLTALFQTELAIDTDIMATGTNWGVMNMDQDVLATKESCADKQYLVCSHSLFTDKRILTVSQNQVRSVTMNMTGFTV